MVSRLVIVSRTPSAGARLSITSINVVDLIADSLWIPWIAAQIKTMFISASFFTTTGHSSDKGARGRNHIAPRGTQASERCEETWSFLATAHLF